MKKLLTAIIRFLIRPIYFQRNLDKAYYQSDAESINVNPYGKNPYEN